MTDMGTLVTMSKRDSDPSQGLNAAVAAVLNGERVAAGMTFEQLAEVSGISKQQLMRLLSTTQRHIDVDVLALLAGIFRATSAQIIVAAEERLQRPAPTDPAAYASFRNNKKLQTALDVHTAPEPTPVEKVKKPRRKA